MNQKKILILIGIIISIVLSYSVLGNYKYATSLMDLFRNETSILTTVNRQEESIQNIILKKVSNEEKNNILREEIGNIGSIGSWLFALKSYHISNQKINDLAVDKSSQVIDKIDYMNSLIDKDINDFNGENIKFLENYINDLTIISENSIEILDKIQETLVIPIYTRSQIEKNIYNISDAI